METFVVHRYGYFYGAYPSCDYPHSLGLWHTPPVYCLAFSLHKKLNKYSTKQCRILEIAPWIWKWTTQTQEVTQAQHSGAADTWLHMAPQTFNWQALDTICNQLNYFISNQSRIQWQQFSRQSRFSGITFKQYVVIILTRRRKGIRVF